MLTHKTIENLKPKDKDYKKADSEGLYLNVRKTGKLIWRFKYHHPYRKNPKTGRLVERLLTIGAFPAVSLKEARMRRDEAQALLLQNIDPVDHEKAMLMQKAEYAEVTFESAGRAWYAHNEHRWETKNAAKILHTLEKDIFSAIGGRSINDLTVPEILKPLRAVEGRGSYDQAARLRQRCAAIFRFAISEGWKSDYINPVNELQGALKVYQVEHYHFLRIHQIPDFLKQLDAFKCNPVIKLALKLVVLTGLRTDELRGGRWSEVDFERKEWRVVTERTKMKRAEHIVPLSRQAIGLLQQVQDVSKGGEFIFPVKTKHKPMSSGAMIKVVYDLGYKGKTTVHGFRSTFSTTANEHEWREDVVEAQLSHKETGVRASYNHALYLSQRHELMQWYADLIDSVCAGGDVVPINRKLVNS